MIDNLDRKLIECMQIVPRATWVQLAPILAVSPSTLSRRWETLVADGLAWTTCSILHLDRARTLPAAFIQVACQGTNREKLVEHFVNVPGVVTCERTSGRWELLLTVMFVSYIELDNFMTTHVYPHPEVDSASVIVMRSIYADGGDFTLRVLTDEQRMETLALRERTGSGDEHPPPSKDLINVAYALQPDARRPINELAADVGISPQRTRSIVRELIGNPWIHLRTDFAREQFGLAASVYLCLDMPPNKVESVVTSLKLVPATRLISSVVSSFTILVCFWLEDLKYLDPLERNLTRVFPFIRITDRWMVLAGDKRAGHRLAPDGRKIGFVPEARLLREAE